MLVQARGIQTPLMDSVTTSDFTWPKNPEITPALPYDWKQANLNADSGYVSNTSLSLSSLGDTEYQAVGTQYRDRFIQLAWPVLNHFFRQTDRPLSPDSDSSAQVAAWLGEPDIAASDLNSIQFFIVYGTSRFPVELVSALDDLKNATVEAVEEGFPCPSDLALENADRLLREMHGVSRRRYEVYPTPDGEIAIDAPGGFGRSVVLLCDSKGGALCLVNMNGDYRRARYSTTENLPDGFVREALAELELDSDRTE